LPEELQRSEAKAHPLPAPSISLLNPGTTAFVGRCLRGPLHEPTLVRGLEEFQRVFGGLWQPSMLSYAVEQFFSQGGSEALIVRVANGARAATLSLPAGHGVIRLRGVVPGTREYLRAAVDYDGISDGEHFNLTVQRLLAPGTEQIECQESFRQVSWRPGAEQYLGEALLHSRLVRCISNDGDERPQSTWRLTAAGHQAYVASNVDGDDGARLTDYDLIGSPDARSGLQALQATDIRFGMLCLPPLDRDRDVGIAALVVAARLCRTRQALLLVDPPADWTDASSALQGLGSWPLQAAEACMFFPRVSMPDRQRGRTECFGNVGAVAGMLARADELAPLPAANIRLQLRAPLQPVATIAEGDVVRLERLGVNTLRSASAALVTMVTELQGRRSKRCLRARRLAQLLAASIERGTRWAVFEQPGEPLWLRLRAQVTALLESVRMDGGLAGNGVGASYQVICDLRLNDAAAQRRGELQLLYGIAQQQPGQFDIWLVRHRSAGSSVQPVSANAQLFGAVAAT
jgi:hypothetical protein